MTPNINSRTLSHIVSVPNHARIWRKDTLIKMGNYNEYLPISDDYELLLRTAVQTKMVKLPMLGYIQYMNDNQNNFSLIRNSEINRLRGHLTTHCFQDWNIESVMEQKNAIDNNIEDLPIWKHKHFEYKYCNEIKNMEHTMQYCILGMSAFYQHYSQIKLLYEDPQNDFIILENAYESDDDTIGNVLDRFKMNRIHFYSMKDCSEDELINYFNHLYKSTSSIILKKKETILEINLSSKIKKISIITPCIRPENLLRVKESIPFEFVHEWIIVYDESQVSNPHLFRDDKIKEYSFKDNNSKHGNAQRNYGLDHLTGDTYVYFLDDDNIIHPQFHTLIQKLEPNRIYTFDQMRNPNEFPFKQILTGEVIEMFHIDTSMFLVDSSLCKHIRWVLDEYASDAIFIVECYSNHPKQWIYVNQVLSYYNCLNNLELFSKEYSCLQTKNMLESI
jgi:predicted nucleic acid-binding Zn finger protein